MNHPPNIVLIHWHDTGRYLGAYGVRGVSTPNIDRLGNEGVLFEQAFSTSPLCSPARASIFTGRYPHSNGMLGLSHLGWEYNPNEETLPMMLSNLGYSSVLVGLQHESSNPRRLGFDEVHNLNAEEQYAAPVSSLASIYLRDRARKDQPFFLTVGFFEPHRPFSDDLYGVVDPSTVDVPDYLPDLPEVRADLASFAAAISAADSATGVVLDALADAGLDDNTIVVFTTDHGIPFPGAKSTLYDAGVGVSLIVKLPGVHPGKRGVRVPNLVSHVDLVPTLVELAGGKPSPYVQGESFAQWLTAGDGWHRDEVFAEKNWHDRDQYDPIRLIRTEDYSYIENEEGQPALSLPGDIASSATASVAPVRERAAQPRPRVELYDVKADPSQQRNLADDESLEPIRRDLAERLHEWQRQTDDPALDMAIRKPREAGVLQRQIVINRVPSNRNAQ